MDVQKSSFLPISAEVLADAQEMRTALKMYMRSTPEQRAQQAAGAALTRVEERAAAERVPLTLDALLDRLGFDQAYAEHFVQPYCTCSDSDCGWDYCQHASDEGLR
jgi:hypothetical protein